MSKLLVDMEKSSESRLSQDNTISDEPLKSETDVAPNESPVDATPEDVSATPKATNPKDVEYEYITGYKLFLVIGIVTLVAFIMLLDTSIVVTAIPRITTDFHSLGDVGWYGSAYLLSSSALQPLAGKMYSEWSSKWTFLTFVGIFEVGSLLCGVSVNSKMLIVGRAVAGMGAAGLMNGALTILSNSIPLEKRATYLGIMMAFAQLGILFGPLIGGALTEYTTWRWCFYINLPVGAAAGAALVFIHVPDRVVKTDISTTLHKTFKTLDIIGFLLFAPSIIMFLLALEWGGTNYPWADSRIIGLFCGAAGMFVVFALWEYRRGDTAMIPFTLVSKRIVYCSMLTMFFFFGVMMITSYYLAIYFQAVKGITPMLSGVYLLPSILSQMLFAVVSGVLVGKLGYYLPWIILSTAMNAIGMGLIATFKPDTNTATWIGYQIIVGVGRGCGMQMPIVAISNFLPQSQNSIGMSVIAFAQTFGGSIFLSVAETTFSAGLKSGLHKYVTGVTPLTVETAGATGFRALLPKIYTTGIIKAYNLGVQEVFYLAAGCAVACFFASWGLGWKSIKKAKVVAPEA